MKILIYTLIILSIVDTCFTSFILSSGGTEENPVMAYVINNYGMFVFAIIKNLLVASMAIVLYKIVIHRSCYERLIRNSLLCLNLVYVAIVVWEIYLVSYIISI